MSLLLMFDDILIEGQPGQPVEMMFEDDADVFMVFEDDTQMVFEG